MSNFEIILIVLAAAVPIIALVIFLLVKKQPKKIKPKTEEKPKVLPKLSAEDQEIAELKQKIFEEQLVEEQRREKELSIQQDNQKYMSEGKYFDGFVPDIPKSRGRQNRFEDFDSENKQETDFEKFRKRFEAFDDDDENFLSESGDGSIKDEVQKLSPKMKAILFTDILKPKD